jgi:hypothetical protein
VELGKVEIIKNIVDNDIQLIRKTDERTEKHSDAKKHVIPSE